VEEKEQVENTCDILIVQFWPRHFSKTFCPPTFEFATSARGFRLLQRFSTCGPWPTGGLRTSAWWAATRVGNWEIFYVTHVSKS